MARDPKKLKTLLTERGIYDSVVANNLTIVKGNATDAEAVRQTLLYKDTPVDIIICGIGGKISFDNPLKPTLDNPTVCQDATRTILAAVQTLMQENPEHQKPLLTVLSTTGISSKRDLPVLMIPMYHWMLKVPHEDKKKMEDLIYEHAALPEAQRGLRNYMIVRPSFLTEGKGDGLAKVKVGTEEKPAVGYVIARNDVGAWLFQHSVRNAMEADNEYLGKVVTITD